MLDAQFWRKTGIDVVACYRRHIFDSSGTGSKARDVFGNRYPDYKSEKYKEAKRTGRMFRQASKFKGSNAPVLSSDLMRDFKAFKSHKTGFGFGATAQRGKVKSLARKGRVLYTDQKPLPDECSQFLMNELDKDVKGAFKKIRRAIKRKKININIG